MIAALGAWWTLRKASGLFMPIVIGMVSLFIVTSVGAFALFINGIKNDRDRAVNDALRSKVSAQIAQQSLAISRERQMRDAVRLNDFGKVTSQLDLTWSEILARSNGITANGPIARSVADLNRFSDDTRRMLEKLSRFP